MAPPIPRRAVLRATVLGGLAGVGAGCTHLAGSPASAPPGPGLDWSALDAAVEGRVVLPGGPEYAAAKSIFNSRYDGSTPAAVVGVRSARDVQEALWFAAGHHLKVTARSGGHSYTGASAADGALVLDLHGLPGGVRYDLATQQVTVTPATTLWDVHQTLAGVGRAIPAGTCPTVGTGGLTLGGGLGADSRRAGLTCDALVSAATVLPSGKTVTARAERHPDVFWALRGGGPLGITTSMTFSTTPAGGADIVHLFFPGPAVAEVITGWRRWLRNADRSVWALVTITVDGSGALGVSLLATGNPGAGDRVQAGIVDAVGVAPVQTRRRAVDRMGLVRYLAGGSPTSQPRGFVAGSDVIETLDDAAAESILAAVRAWPPGRGGAAAVLDSVDGAVGDVEPAGSAFPWRRSDAIVQWYADTPDATAATAASGWLDGAHETVQAHSLGGYLNYVEPATPRGRYFGANLARLMTIRGKHDPGGLILDGLDS